MEFLQQHVGQRLFLLFTFIPVGSRNQKMGFRLLARTQLPGKREGKAFLGIGDRVINAAFRRSTVTTQ